MINKAKKADIVEKLSVRISKNPYMYITDASDLSVAHVNRLRARCHAEENSVCGGKEYVDKEGVREAVIGGISNSFGGGIAGFQRHFFECDTCGIHGKVTFIFSSRGIAYSSAHQGGHFGWGGICVLADPFAVAFSAQEQGGVVGRHCSDVVGVIASAGGGVGWRSIAGFVAGIGESAKKAFFSRNYRDKKDST